MKNVYIAMLVALFLSACGTRGPAAEKPVMNKHAILGAKLEILPGQRRAEGILKVLAVRFASEHAPDRVEAILRLPPPTVYWVDNDPSCGSGLNAFRYGKPTQPNNPNSNCYLGLHFSWNRIYVARQEAISASALAHEVGGHGYRYFILGDGDAKHADLPWWQYWEEIGSGIIRFHEEMENGKYDLGAKDKHQ